VDPAAQLERHVKRLDLPIAAPTEAASPVADRNVPGGGHELRSDDLAVWFQGC
jgi:hypothetical protein